MPPETPHQVAFQLCNESPDKAFRMTWQQHADVVFTPAISHVFPNSTVGFIATARCAAPVAHKPLKVTLTAIEITYLGG